MGHLQEYFAEKSQELQELPDRREVLEALIELGKELPEFPEREKIPKNKVHGCVSGVYMKLSRKENMLIWEGHADSLILKGYVKMLCEGCSGITAEEFLRDAEPTLKKFVEETNLGASLVASRANAFGNILLFMKERVETIM